MSILPFEPDFLKMRFVIRRGNPPIYRYLAFTCEKSVVRPILGGYFYKKY